MGTVLIHYNQSDIDILINSGATWKLTESFDIFFSLEAFRSLHIWRLVWAVVLMS